MKRLWLFWRGRRCLTKCGAMHTYGAGCLVRIPPGHSGTVRLVGMTGVRPDDAYPGEQIGPSGMEPCR